LFALGAVVAQLGSGDAATSASIYLLGGVFFSSGAYGSVLQAVNFPPGTDAVPSASAERRWRWWSYEPMQSEWLAAFILFAGTLAFGISLLSAFIEGLSVQQENRLIWAPDMAGCILFLLSGRLLLVSVRDGGPWLRPRDLVWWVAALNQVGSVLFFIAGLAAFIRPATESAANIDVANWGTFGGALCFAAGGVLQALEQKGGARRGAGIMRTG
jgi:hypothetical protein